MNLEDFKSFRRVLKPSGVGSIPTHSRHAVLAALLVLFVAGPARGDGAVPEGTPSPLQRAFVKRDAMQCGFCTSGMLVSCTALLRKTRGTRR